jgi:hypothetical protein
MYELIDQVPYGELYPGGVVNSGAGSGSDCVAFQFLVVAVVGEILRIVSDRNGKVPAFL